MRPEADLRSLKSIQAHVREGIGDVEELRAALQTAVQLEFATIPPYLCAAWSIDTDPNDVGGTIMQIVVQEMFHFAIAGNILSALGGRPVVASKEFLPAYPTAVLPGGIAQELPVDLQPLSAQQLDVFMQIELPAFPPVAFNRVSEPATIGAFYATIAEALQALNPPFDPQAKFMTSGPARPIISLEAALAGLDLIRGEGEGTEGSPDQPGSNSALFAHYYLFKEVRTGRRLRQVDGQWEFTGDAVAMPTARPFAPRDGSPNPSQAFMAKLKELMEQLQRCWDVGGRPSISLMRDLQGEGVQLIGQGITPNFEWPRD